MLLGKEKCKALKEIRKKIAEENDIEYAVSECSHKGDCKGTCPKCEAELRYLEKELERKQRLGQKVAVAGISVGMAAAISGCSPAAAAEFVVSPVNFFLNEAGYGNSGYDSLAGVAAPPEISGDMAIEPDYQLDGEEEYIGPDEEEYDIGNEDENEGGSCSGDDEVYELEGDVDYVPDNWDFLNDDSDTEE